MRFTFVVLNLFEKNKKIYLHFQSFLNTEMAEVVETLPCERQGPIYPTVNSMVAGDLATQGTRSSAAMVLTKLTWNILVWGPEGLMSVVGVTKAPFVNFYVSKIFDLAK